MIRNLDREQLDFNNPNQKGLSASDRVLRQGCEVKYAFVAEHRQQFSVRTMCHCLRIHPSRFYVWLKTSLSNRSAKLGAI